MSKTIEVETTWRSTVQIEVEEGDDTDYTQSMSNLSDFPEYVLEQMTSDTATLIDWEVNA